MSKLDHLTTVRSLIDDIDGVTFGKVPELLDEMAVECDRAIDERNRLKKALEEIADLQGRTLLAGSLGDDGDRA